MLFPDKAGHPPAGNLPAASVLQGWSVITGLYRPRAPGYRQYPCPRIEPTSDRFGKPLSLETVLNQSGRTSNPWRHSPTQSLLGHPSATRRTSTETGHEVVRGLQYLEPGGDSWSSGQADRKEKNRIFSIATAILSPTENSRIAATCASNERLRHYLKILEVSISAHLSTMKDLRWSGKRGICGLPFSNSC